MRGQPDRPPRNPGNYSERGIRWKGREYREAGKPETGRASEWFPCRHSEGQHAGSWRVPNRVDCREKARHSFSSRHSKSRGGEITKPCLAAMGQAPNGKGHHRQNRQNRQNRHDDPDGRPPNDRESGSTRGRGRVRELASAPSEQTPKRQEPAPDTIFLLTRAEELPHLENPENTSPRNSSAPRAHSGWHFHSQRTSNRPRRKMKTWRM